MNNLLKRHLYSGQAVLIVLLGMAVTLTIVLSIVSRSITDISLTSTDIDSARAFSAAEAGVENLIIGTGIGTNPLEGGVSSYTGNVGKYAVNSDSIDFSEVDQYYSGESATLWLVSHDTDHNNKLSCSVTNENCFTGNQVKVCWGNKGTENDKDETPAIEVSVYYDETRNSIAASPNYLGVKVARTAYDPYANRRETNKFSEPTEGVCTITTTSGDKSYAFSKTINLTDLILTGGCLGNSGCLLFTRIKFLYNTTTTHNIGVVVSGGNATLPSQGKLISSTGTSGNATRKVEVIDLFKSPLGIFEAGLFSAGSGANLTKPDD